MEFPLVSDAEMQAASMLTGATMALWLSVGLVPALRRHAARIRLLVLAAYLAAAAAFLLYLFAR